MSFLAQSSQTTSLSLAASMVTSNSGLSLFDKPLDRHNRDVVCGYLNELPHKIVAIWLVARPVNGISNGYTFEHWCVKIQTTSCLLSIDFMESKGRGKFALSVTSAMEAELHSFLMYAVHTDEGKQELKWRIVASVTPSPLINSNYKPSYLDPHEISTLRKYMKSLKKKSKKPAAQNIIDDDIVLKTISCNKTVCDIADFLEMWTEFEMKGKKKDKPYSALTHNCQQFAFDLFKYLVGNNYPKKVDAAAKQLQSPADIKAYQKESQSKPNVTHQHKQNHYNNIRYGALIEEEEPEDNDDEDDDVKTIN